MKRNQHIILFLFIFMSFTDITICLDFYQTNKALEKITLGNYKTNITILDTLTDFIHLKNHYSRFIQNYRFIGLIINDPQNGIYSEKQKNDLNKRNISVINEFCIIFTNDFQTIRICWFKNHKIYDETVLIREKDIVKLLNKIGKGVTIEKSWGYCNNDVTIYNYNGKELFETYFYHFWCFPSKENNLNIHSYKNRDHRSLYMLLIKLYKMRIFTESYGFQQTN